MSTLKLSRLSKTWIIDLDGTIFPHNGYLQEPMEKVLSGVKDFFRNVDPNDFVMILTSRKSIYREITELSLEKAGIKWDMLVMDVPTGERILINDSKPSGLVTAFAVSPARNEGLADIEIEYSDSL